MATITVLDSTGATQTVAKVVNTGTVADANSLPVTQSTEDKAVATASGASLASIDAKTPALSGGTVPVSAAALPLPAGAATEATLAGIGNRFSASVPLETTQALPITQTPQKTWRAGFDAAVAAGPDTTYFTAIANGSGIAVAQSGGSLVITTGATAYSETILRSVPSWMGTNKSRYSLTLSQRIVNCEVYIELVDVIGDGLTIVHTSSTTVVVTIPSNPFTAANVGQSVYIGAISVAASLNQRAAITSISGNDVTFTGAGFAATGTGTCSLFGWNYHHAYYDGTVATSTKYGTCRNGWASADVAVTINTTATGHIGVVTAEAGKGAYLDQLSASSTTVELVQRGSSVRNVPEDQTALRYQIRVRNLATAPASTTTVTVGFVEADQFVAQQMSLIGVEAMSANQALPVQLVGTTGTVGTVTTVSTVTAVTTLANGQTAHSAASTGSPVRVGGRVNTTVDTTLVAGDASDLFITTSGSAVVKQYAAPELDWSYAAATGGITNTTAAVTVKAAGAAGVRNYITGVQLSTDTLGAATEFAIRDGAAGTVIWRCKLNTTALPLLTIDFPTPLRGTAATLVEIVTLTASVTGGVFANLQGYQAP